MYYERIIDRYLSDNFIFHIFAAVNQEVVCITKES